MDAYEVYEMIKKQIPFIRGITVSGGECMLHPEFLKELFTLAVEDGLGTLIDSNGTIDFSKEKELLEVSDGVMLDIKAFSSEEHKKLLILVMKSYLKMPNFYHLVVNYMR